MAYKQPLSVLVLVYTGNLDVLLIERADFPEHWQSVTGSAEAGEVLGAGNRHRAEGCEVIGDPLDVEQFGASVGQPFHQRNESGFRCVGRGVEHRLAGEESIDTQPVQPADQLVVEEHLDRAAPPELE